MGFRNIDPSNTSNAGFGQRVYQGLASGGISELSNFYNNAQVGNTNASIAGNNAWSSLGLDPSLYSGNVRNMKKGLEMSGADLQSALVNQQLAERSAQLEYDLSKKMYDETQSFQAQVEQMKAAGLNPALMYGSSIQSTGGADSPSVGSGSSSNSGSAVQGHQASANAFLGAGSLAVDAFQQAMSIPIMKEQARSMTIQNDRQEAMDAYYRRQIIAQTEKDESDARQSVVDAFVAESTKNNRVEVSNLDVVAKRNDVDLQELRKVEQTLNNKMKEVDAKYQEQFINLNITYQAMQIYKTECEASHLNKQTEMIDEEMKKIKAETVKLWKECDILDKEIEFANDNHFLAYVQTANGWVNAMTSKTSVAVNAGLKGISGAFSGEFEKVDGAVNAVLQTLHDKFGDTDAYASLFAGEDVVYGGITPISRGTHTLNGGKLKYMSDNMR